MRLTLKFTLALAVGVCVILSLFGVVRIGAQSSFFHQTLRSQHRELGRGLGISIEEVWRLDGEARALQLVSSINQQDVTVNLRWVWVDDGASDYYRPAAPLQALAGVQTGDDVVWSDRGQDKTDRMYTYVPINVPAARHGALELMTSLEPLAEQERQALWAITSATVGILLLSVALALGLGFVMVGRPVQRLVLLARRIGAGDFSQPLPVRGRNSVRYDDEITELTQEINAMCDQLAEAIEARIAAVNRLRHADRLATVGTLASGIAHELGTPLATVSMRASLIASGTATTPDNRDNAKVIRQQCERMTRIIRQLLDFSRPRRCEPETLALQPHLESTVKLLEPIAKKEGVRVVVDTPRGDAAPCIARFDPTQLQQVVSNLMVNALHASERGSEIHLGAEPAVPAEPPPDYAGPWRSFHRLYVTDSGAGIEPQDLPHLFDPFFTTKDVGKGTGLGLAVAYGIVREHSGWIDVQSAVGQGTTFSVFLPQEESQT